jgi:hypothetical protein
VRADGPADCDDDSLLTQLALFVVDSWLMRSIMRRVLVALFAHSNPCLSATTPHAVFSACGMKNNDHAWRQTCEQWFRKSPAYHVIVRMRTANPTPLSLHCP